MSLKEESCCKESSLPLMQILPEKPFSEQKYFDSRVAVSQNYKLIHIQKPS